MKTRALYQTDGRLVKWGAIIEDKNITILSHGERAAEIKKKSIVLYLDPLECSKSDLRAICAGIEQEAGINGLSRKVLAEYDKIGGYKLKHNY